jgi:NDP-sugar pyrophosphorylase family protein
MTIDTIIIAGGKGTRQGRLSNGKPKHILPVMNKPLIDYHIENLTPFDSIFLSYSEFSESFFKEYLQKYPNVKGRLDAVMKGSLYPAIELSYECDDTVIAIAGDMFARLDLQNIVEYHKSQNCPFTLVATKTFPTANACVFDVGCENNLLGMTRLENATSAEDDLINLGCYVIDSRIMDFLTLEEPIYKEDYIFRPYNLLCANLNELGSESKIGSGSHIDGDSVIENSVIGNNVIVKGSKISNAVVMDGSYIEDSKIEYAIIQDNSTIKKSLINVVYILQTIQKKKWTCISNDSTRKRNKVETNKFQKHSHGTWN